MSNITNYTCWDFTEGEPIFVKFERNEETGQVKVLVREPRKCPFIEHIENDAKQLIFKHKTRIEGPTYATHH